MSTRDHHSLASSGPGSGEDGPLTAAAASFLARVLGLESSPNALAELREDLSAIKRDHNAAIYTVQLDSSVGPAAFLVYAFLLDARGGDGKTGREMYEAGVRTLEEAAERNSPGPRAVANAETDDYGFILATTPGTYRALNAASQRTATRAPASEPPPAAPASSAPRPASAPLAPSPPRRPARAPVEPPEPDNDTVRSDAADRLLVLLKDANAEAKTWLNALVAASKMATDTESEDDLIAFNTAETALALHVLDEENVSALLRALNLLVAGAEQHARAALNKTEPDD